MSRRPSPTRSCYLVEWYRPDLTNELLQQTAQDIGRSAREQSAEDTMVELLLTLFVPEDEVAFCLFAANSRASVTQVCRRAELPFHRIAEAISTPAAPHGSAASKSRVSADEEPPT
jgi:hypothetical protein